MRWLGGKKCRVERVETAGYPETFRLPNSLREVGPEEIFSRSTMKLRHWNVCDAHQVRRALQPSFQRPDGLYFWRGPGSTTSRSFKIGDCDSFCVGIFEGHVF